MSFETTVEVEFRDQVRVLGSSFRMGVEVMFQDRGWGGFQDGGLGRVSGQGIRVGFRDGGRGQDQFSRLVLVSSFGVRANFWGWRWYSGRRSGSNFGVGSGFKLGSG